MENSEWRELTNHKKPNFLAILRVLNHYYSSLEKNSNEKKGHLFRKKLESAPLETISIFIKKFGKYEYLIHAKLNSIDNGTKNEEDTWIHFDGIQEERDNFTDEGIQDHPVFYFEALTDIFYTGTVPTSREDLP